MKVACKGSGRHVGAGLNAKRATCPVCGNPKDLASNGNIKKHDRVVTKQQLRKIK